jgi:mannose-6-phosphate isomerase-like protein (cupin superfamily)
MQMQKRLFVVCLLMLISLYSIDCARHCATIPKESAEISTKYGEYPVPGRLEGTTSFAHQDDMPKLCNASYPAWYRGNAPNGLADSSSMHFYHTLIGPNAKTGFNPKHFMSGYYELKPGATYPAHNHPAREYYYVIEGEADWWADDEMRHVTAGTAIYHRPYTVHGWTNTSKSKPLRLLWCWWIDEGDSLNVLDIGGRFTNPDLCKSRETAKAYAVPLPSVRKK